MCVCGATAVGGSVNYLLLEAGGIWRVHEVSIAALDFIRE